jgi:hypothetical protein
MAVTTRQGLIDYCLRELGEPVIEINVDVSQLEDRVDEALEFFRLYHYDGIEKVYLKHQIRASEMNLTTSVAENFQKEEVVTGSTSGAKARVTFETNRLPEGTLLLVRDVDGTFVAGETITGGISGQTATLGTTPVILREYDNRYIETTDLVYGITRILPFSAASSSKNLFDLQYQLRLNDLYDLTSTSLIYYKTVMSHIALLDLELNGHPQFRFNRLQNRLYLDINWAADVAVGDFIVVECYRAMDPAIFNKVWGEPWLKKYTTALFKRQWGANGKKFQGMQLPGGVSIDFQGMYDEAQSEIKELEDEMVVKSAPLEFYMG